MFFCANDGLKVDEENQDVFENYEEFSCKSKFVEKDELVEGCSFLKLKDDKIKSLIEEPRIYNAYLHYVLKSFNDNRMTTPESVKITTQICKGDNVITVEDFIIKNFKTTADKMDRLYTTDIAETLAKNGYNVSGIECGRLMSRIGIGKYNEKCNINGIRKKGYEFIKFIEESDI